MKTEKQLIEGWGGGIEPVVSICCITYNHENYIEQALQSFLMQETSFAFEIVIHDDASPDNTAEIIRRYEREYPNIIKPIYQTENQKSKFKGGMNPRFNYPRALGKYIALCEGDDYWTDPYKLQKQVDFLEANPEYVVCCHNAKIVDENGVLIQEKKLPKLNQDRDYTSIELQKGAFLLTLSLVFRNVGITSFPSVFNGTLNGDTITISLLGAHGKGRYIEDIQPAVYRVHSGGVWSLMDIKKRLIAKRNLNNAFLSYYKNIPELYGHFIQRQTTVSREMLRNMDKTSGLLEYFKTNLFYMRYNSVFTSKYRLKELLRCNWHYWRRKVVNNRKK